MAEWKAGGLIEPKVSKQRGDAGVGSLSSFSIPDPLPWEVRPTFIVEKVLHRPVG